MKDCIKEQEIWNMHSERIEKLKRPILERKQMGLQFEGQERSGKDVVVMKEVSKGFAGRPLFEQANLHVSFSRACGYRWS